MGEAYGAGCLEVADLLETNGERTFGACLLGDKRSDLYSSLFLFFPRFSSSSLRDAASAVHNRRGSPNSFDVPDDGATGSSFSPVRSMASISSAGESKPDVRSGLMGVVVDFLKRFRDEGGRSYSLSVRNGR